MLKTLICRLFSVLYGIWVANLVAFNGVLARASAEQFLALAEKQADTVPLVAGNHLISALRHLGESESRAHYDRALAHYDPGEHRSLATRFGIVDAGWTP